MSVKTDANIHISVLLHELVTALDIQTQKQNIIVDATLGLAGHASTVISQMHEWDIFIGFDADERNLTLARERLQAMQSSVKIILIHSNFEHLAEKLTEQNIEHITAIYYDLWVSSLHFDEAERGFSLRLDGPLDMRFDTRTGKTAADILNYAEEKEIYEILKNYWEEPQSRKIASEIVKQRKIQKFQTTKNLTEFLDTKIHTHIKIKMRVFQALRIEVNHELETLKRSLTQTTQLLQKDGKIFVISFHSLEDRIVKHFFQKEARDCICQSIICTCWHQATLKILSKKPILPNEKEQKENSRSRSAKGRIAQKI